MKRFLYKLKKFDWVLFVSTLLLSSVGLVVIYGIALSHDSADFSSLLRKQAVALVLGLVLFFIATFIDYKIFYNYARSLYGIGLALLAAVLVIGSRFRGTKGWFSLAGFNFQPIEFVKIAVIIILAFYFSRLIRPLNQGKYLIFSGLLAFFPFVLTILQPDFGSALVLFAIWFGLVLVIGLNWRQLFLLIGAGFLIFLISWSFVFVPYQKERVMTFLNPAADPLGAGYNVAQSVIAIGSGQWTGRGLSFGSQSQLKFLPEAQTDFVFAVIAEEFGFLGIALVLGLFSIIFYRLYKIAKKCRDDFSLFLVIGTMIMIFFQVILNVGMNLGIAPVTGVTLPLVSYGGSSLIFSLMALGMVESIKTKE